MSVQGREFDEAMVQALRLASAAGAEGDVPVGAVVLDHGGKVIGVGRNRREADGDPFAHAELEALGDAARRRNGADGEDSGGVCGCRARGSGATEAGDRASAAADVGVRRAWNLADCTLVVTLEPCPMCAGAALETHVGRIVFGAWDAKLGACGSVWDIPRDPHVGAVPEIIGGVREPECARLLKDFFVGHRRPHDSNE
ncbi:nucleoside deaminase [Bifidobacterium bombi]|uniref:tRNA-specific adenosine deaminase n=1 Tax=Bifidobacterium bombi DSM 19703 TaxID=1341695 RepID=A0A086BPF4_9BIFI|nr:nucleoside deaminase [Bifidobacterium bombi]KFF31818.1 cytosine/adenosine deaminase [Bifidobacterium bombi DSM 19703]